MLRWFRYTHKKRRTTTAGWHGMSQKQMRKNGQRNIEIGRRYGRNWIQKTITETKTKCLKCITNIVNVSGGIPLMITLTRVVQYLSLF